MAIEWRDVPGWEGAYKVSSDGQVLSLSREQYIDNRWGMCYRRTPERLMKPHIRRDGYASVRLRTPAKAQTVLIHRLVAIAFLGPPAFGQEVCHNNGNRADNRVENLRWDTRAANHRDKLKHGTTCRGVANPQAKLNERQVRAIRKSGVPQHQLAVQYGVCQQLVSQIKRRMIWRHID